MQKGLNIDTLLHGPLQYFSAASWTYHFCYILSTAYFMCVHYSRATPELPTELPLNSSLNCPWVQMNMCVSQNLKYLNCICDAVISSAYLTYFISFVWLTIQNAFVSITKNTLWHLSRSHIQNNWKIDVVAICSRLFKYANTYAGLHMLSYIFPLWRT